MERIFELKEYNDKNVFKFAILKIKGCKSLWCENLKRNRVSDGKSKIKA